MTRRYYTFIGAVSFALFFIAAAVVAVISLVNQVWEWVKTW